MKCGQRKTGLDGYEVGRRVREALGRQIRLIALTGYGQNEDRERALQAGFDAHMGKPIDFPRLKQLLSEAKSTAPATS